MACCNAAAVDLPECQAAIHKRADAHQRFVAFSLVRIYYKLH
jgi:hypothetical protein